MKLLIIAGTNFELYFLSSVVQLLKSKDSSLKFHLLIKRNFYNNITSELEDLYDKVKCFDMPTVSKFWNFGEIFRFRKLIREKLKDTDIVLISCFPEFFANIMCRVAPKKTRLIALRMANTYKDTPYERRPVISFLLNIKNWIFGYSTMDYKFRPGSRDYLVSKTFKKYPYHRTMSFNNTNPPPFFALKDIYRIKDETPCILIAGDKTPVYPQWTKEDQGKYDDFFDYLRTNFKDYKLYFKPKPGKTKVEEMELAGFEVLRPESSLEEFLLTHNVKKVISIRSGASKLGTYFGIPSYHLYPLFSLPEDMVKDIENEHSDTTSVVKVEKLDDLKKDGSFQDYTLESLANMYYRAIVE